MDNLIDKIDSSDWADRTKKNRKSFVINLKKKLDPSGKGYKFLNDFKKIKDYIYESENASTRKNKVLTIKSILTLIGENKMASKYDQLALSLIQDNETYKGNNIVDADKWISYEEMTKMPESIESDIKFVYDKLFLTDKEINDLRSINGKYKYLRMLTDYIIAVLYCWQPPVRNDWCTVLLSSKLAKKSANWYDQTRGIVHWFNFKNVKAFGARSFKLNAKVKNVLDEYLSILHFIIDDAEYLIYLVGSKTIKPFTREGFSTYTSRLFSKYSGKKISINTLRHVFETHLINSPGYNQMTINEKKEIHDRLLHSYKTGQEYLKVEPEE